MLSFEKDLSIFTSTSDFGVNVKVGSTLFTALFNYETIEEGNHQSKQPIIITSATNSSILKEGVELVILGHSDGIDKAFKVRSMEYDNSNTSITVALSDVITSTYDQILDRYIP